MAKKRAGGQSAPEAWIGRQVLLGIGTGNSRAGGELREVNDRGVVITHETESARQAAPGQEEEREVSLVFYPWHYVRAIRVPDKEQTE